MFWSYRQMIKLDQVNSYSIYFETQLSLEFESMGHHVSPPNLVMFNNITKTFSIVVFMKLTKTLEPGGTWLFNGGTQESYGGMLKGTRDGSAYINMPMRFEGYDLLD